MCILYTTSLCVAVCIYSYWIMHGVDDTATIVAPFVTNTLYLEASVGSTGIENIVAGCLVCPSDRLLSCSHSPIHVSYHVSTQ